MTDHSRPDPAAWHAARRRVSRLRLSLIGLWTALVWALGHGRLPGLRPIGYFVGAAIIWLAADAITDLHYGRRYGVISDSAAGWVWRRLKALSFAAVFLLVVVGPLPSAMAWWPHGWWLPMTLWLGAAWSVWTALIPAWVLPRLITIRPLPAGPVAEALADLARQAGSPLRAALWAVSKRSTAVQAVVVGFGPTQQVLLTDTLVDGFAPAEVAAVVAHEISHLERHDLLRRGAFLTLGIGAVLATAAGVTTGTAWDVPLLITVTIAVVTGYFRYLRHLEVTADRRAVALTGDGDAYGRTLRKMATANGETQALGFFGSVWAAHPGLAHRLKHLGLPDGMD